MVNAFDQAQTPPPFGTPGTVHADRVWGYAGFWWRVLAWAIDSVILSSAAVTIGEIFGLRPRDMMGGDQPSDGSLFNIDYRPALSGSGIDNMQNWHWQFHVLPMLMPHWANAIAFVLAILYFTLLESSRWQATVGKRVCRLRVTRLDGSRISFGRALGRYFGKYLSALVLGIGFLLVAWTPRKQGLHDLLADTLVVRLRPPSDLVRFNPPA